MLGQTTGVFDVLETAGEFAVGVGKGLAVFVRDQLSQLVGVIDEKLTKGEQDIGARRQRRFAPGDQRLASARHDLIDEAGVGHGHGGADLARGGVVDGRLTLERNPLAVHEMGD